MISNKKKRYKDESLRKNQWDYSSPGSYFLTIDTADHRHVLGKIKDNQMYLSESGKIVGEEIQKLITYNPRIILNKWVIMPNHVHILLTLGPYNYNNLTEYRERPIHELTPKISESEKEGQFENWPYRTVEECMKVPPELTRGAPSSQPIHKPEILNISQSEYRIARRKMVIPKLVGKFKNQTSKKINQLLNTPGKKNWHNDYWDVIILSEGDFRIRWKYIDDNPKKWWEKHKKRRP